MDDVDNFLYEKGVTSVFETKVSKDLLDTLWTNV